MKKVIALLIIVVLTFTLASCANEEAYDLYLKANESLDGAESLYASTTTIMDMSYLDESISMEMTGIIKEIVKSETDIEMEMVSELIMDGETMSFTAYFLDGYYYFDMYGEKYKTEMSIEDMLEQTDTVVIDFPKEAIKAEAVEKIDGGKELVFTLDSSALQDQLDKQVAGLVGFDISIAYGDVSMSMILDKSGQVKSISMSFGFDMESEGETIHTQAEVIMDIIQLGGVTIDYPADLDSYVELTQ